MKPKLFIPQPIPKAAVERLERRCEFTIYPHTDRRMPCGEMLEAVRDQEILYALGEIPYDRQVIVAAAKLKLIENVERYLDGRRPLDVLNPEVCGEAARHDERIG
jgi:lactate dehydrogenase-like 2-hydroxyacid dehydrogenase